MAYDATKMADWQISEAAEEKMKSIWQLGDEMGLKKEEIQPYGRIGKVDFMKVIERLKDKPDGKYIEVTAITPTPLGEGKTTVSMGLVEGMGKRGWNVGGAIRQPSGGPTMNVKGSAAGGGNAQAIPLTEFSLGLTGDINNIMNAHNLAMVALTSRMQHERNYSDAELAKRKLKRLDIDPKNVQMGWIMDFCAQSLRNIVIGLGGKMDGFLMQSRFDIAVSSEVMAILAIIRDLADLRERLGKITVAYDKIGKPVTCERPRSGRRYDRLHEGERQPDAPPDRRGTACPRPCRPVREHRSRPVLHHSRPRGPQALRLQRYGERVRRRHRLREVLERQVAGSAA